MKSIMFWFVHKKVCKQKLITYVLVKEIHIFQTVSSNTHQTKINFIPALPYVLIDSSLKSSIKERHAGKQGVAGSIPGGGIYFHMEFVRLLLNAHSSAKPIRINQA